MLARGTTPRNPPWVGLDRRGNGAAGLAQVGDLVGPVPGGGARGDRLRDRMQPRARLLRENLHELSLAAGAIVSAGVASLALKLIDQLAGWLLRPRARRWRTLAICPSTCGSGGRVAPGAVRAKGFSREQKGAHIGIALVHLAGVALAGGGRTSPATVGRRPGRAGADRDADRAAGGRCGAGARRWPSGHGTPGCSPIGGAGGRPGPGRWPGWWGDPGAGVAGVVTLESR